MINEVVIQGRLTGDPELRSNLSGTLSTRFRMAVKRNQQSAGNNAHTDFINVVARQQTAEVVCRCFAKGSMIVVRGSIQTRSYEDKKGISRTAVEIIANEVEACDEKKQPDSKGGKA